MQCGVFSQRLRIVTLTVIDQVYQLIEYIKRIKRFKSSIVNILYEFYLFRSLSIKVTYHFYETGEGVPCAEFLIYTITS